MKFSKYFLISMIAFMAFSAYGADSGIRDGDEATLCAASAAATSAVVEVGEGFGVVIPEVADFKSVRYAISYYEPDAYAKKINIGEPFFRDGLVELMKKHTLVPNIWDLSEGDYFIILVSNVLGNHGLKCLTDLRDVSERLRETGVKIIFLGIGAQNPSFSDIDLDEPVIKLIKEINPEGPIGVRGVYSKSILDKYSIPCAVLGCPSVFNIKDCSRENKSDRACHKMKFVFQSTSYGNIQASILLDIYGMRNLGKFIPQTEFELFDLMEKSDLLSSLTDSNTRYKYYFINTPWWKRELSRFGVEEFNPEEVMRYLIENAVRIKSSSDWIDKLREYDFLLTSRIHGAIAGLSAGIRTLCVVHDSRTRELCESLKVPYLSEFKITDSLEYLYSIADTKPYYDNLPDVRKRYSEFLLIHGLEL